jgi:hypothetical protein
MQARRRVDPNGRSLTAELLTFAEHASTARFGRQFDYRAVPVTGRSIGGPSGQRSACSEARELMLPAKRVRSSEAERVSAT